MATGDKLVNLDELKLVYDKLHVPSVQVQIPTGQWSGSSTRTYTVNATNVTADTIVDWAMDSSINYLKADLTVTPGSGTIQFSTTAIPAGTINVTLFFPGVNGEVVIQTLADVYSKSQVDQKISQSTAVVSTTLSSSGHPNIDTTKPFNVSVVKTGKTCFARIFSVVPATSASGWSDIITLPSGYTPNWDMNIVLYDDTAGKAVEARMYSDNGTLRIYAPVAGHSYWGTAVYVTA